VAVLKALAEFFCLSSKDLCVLIYRQYTDISRASINRTLRLLEAESLIEWRQRTVHIRKTGSLPVIYGLTKKGVDLAAQEGLVTPTTKIFKPNSDTLLPHEYEISQFHLGLKTLCSAQGWKLYWQQYDLKCGVNPDACFAISKNGAALWYFLEVEKTKPGNFRDGESKIMRNLGKYHAYYDTDRCHKEWANFRKFRVIVTLRNEERSENLLKELSGKYPHRMFWLTDEERYKRGMGDYIFRTPKDYKERTYGFLDI